MPVASAVVVPAQKGLEIALREKLGALKEVEVKAVGKKGIAVVLEAEDIARLREISATINGWEEVLEFELTYLNWEDAS